ncbi:hypothetical protein QNI16_19555 [Cytophagaceae bacterium YF14B1]|uniref:Uncharacterized protein n=1 Tax=Xanthocytophaga flava TaxID=3048013 RepID=A0AAE3QPV8_9BACT|nr:hypothetical protein [Xanthocytophaga flavus]MDJ1482706.1 hypothetical protein [Xanthocytophaga flavus]
MSFLDFDSRDRQPVLILMALFFQVIALLGFYVGIKSEGLVNLITYIAIGCIFEAFAIIYSKLNLVSCNSNSIYVVNAWRIKSYSFDKFGYVKSFWGNLNFYRIGFSDNTEYILFFAHRDPLLFIGLNEGVKERAKKIESEIKKHIEFGSITDI